MFLYCICIYVAYCNQSSHTATTDQKVQAYLTYSLTYSSYTGISEVRTCIWTPVRREQVLVDP